MNKEQIKLLRKIKKCGLFDYSDLSADERDILFYLRKQNFITASGNPNGGRPLYKITELGRAELFSLRQKSFRIWTPIIISLIALIKSFLPELTCLMKSITQLLKALKGN